MKKFFILNLVDGSQKYVNVNCIHSFQEKTCLVRRIAGASPVIRDYWAEGYVLQDGESFEQCVEVFSDISNFTLWVFGTVAEFISLNS